MNFHEGLPVVISSGVWGKAMHVSSEGGLDVLNVGHGEGMVATVQ